MANGGGGTVVNANMTACSDCWVREIETSISLASDGSGRRASPLLCPAMRLVLAVPILADGLLRSSIKVGTLSESLGLELERGPE